MRIAIVAGEASGDILGAGLIEALKRRVPDVEVFGVTGPRMDAAGCESLASIDVLSVMGLVEVLKEVPRLMRFRKTLIEQIIQRQPDVVIGIDAPDFNLGLERRLRARGIKTVHYVSPSVWAWRQGRVKGIARSVDLMLTLFLFEAAFYRDSGIPVRFVGHPLADAIQADPDRTAARARLGMEGAGRVLALLPGSRGSEIDRLAPAFLAAATTLCKRHPDLRCVLPAANPKARARLDELTRGFDLPLTVVDGESQTAMAAADVVMIASGTATLETLLVQRPMVVAYATNALTAWLLLDAGLLKSPHVSLPNLLTDDPAVPELLQGAATADMLTGAAHLLLTQPAYAQAQTRQFAAVHEQLARNADAEAADAVLELLA
ncbi:lipid-A-disaccharide synthase [uncultured Abyssibacter sp.]|uniref:lipid-A-disaccharide synthase n=1 Tax=uncultured Abyssibacter sp. TaxID=2320202 RepID=UPI0032B2152F